MRELIFQVVRFHYYRGKLHEQTFRTAWDNPDMISFLPGSCPPEALFNGLKTSRLFQFQFLAPDSAVMFVPVRKGLVLDNHRAWFMRRVSKLKRKGILTESAEQPEEKKVELHVLHQSCKDCVFAEYKYDQSGATLRTQTGCQLKRLDKYREQGAEIVGAYDEDAEFDIVNGRKCPAYRSVKSEWAKQVPPGDRAATVRRELTVHTDAVIYVGEGDSLQALDATLDSLRRQVLKTSSVTIINNQSEVKPGILVAHLTKAAEGLAWKMVDVRERDGDGNRVNQDRCIDIAAGKLKGHFYTVLGPGQTLPPTFTLDLDRAVVDEMGRFVVLTHNKDGVGTTVSLGFHKAPLVNGNKAVVAADFDEDGQPKGSDTCLLHTVIDKAFYLSQARNSPHLVARAEDVCPSLA